MIGSVALYFKEFHNITITWECCCLNFHWSHEGIFMEIILNEELSQEVAGASLMENELLAPDADM